jgi:hypothetical protein
MMDLIGIFRPVEALYLTDDGVDYNSFQNIFNEQLMGSIVRQAGTSQKALHEITNVACDVLIVDNESYKSYLSDSGLYDLVKKYDISVVFLDRDFSETTEQNNDLLRIGKNSLYSEPETIFRELYGLVFDKRVKERPSSRLKEFNYSSVVRVGIR